MSEQPFASESIPTDFADAFDDWIGGATVAKRSLPIYGKPGLFAEYEALERELQLAERYEEHGAEFAGSPTRTIEARMQEIHDEWMASKSTWTVRAIDGDEIEAIKAEDPPLVEPKAPAAPKPPAPLPAKRTAQDEKRFTLESQEFDKAKAEYEAAMVEHEPLAKAYNEELNYRVLSHVVERVEFADGRVIDGVTVDQLRRLRGSLGEKQILALFNAAMLAAMQESEIPAPFSRTTSESGRTS